MVIFLRHIFLAVLSASCLFVLAQKQTVDNSLQDYWIDKYFSVSFLCKVSR